jgi:hypothetical protein
MRREEIVESIKQTAIKKGQGHLTLSDFSKETGIGSYSINREFDSWNNAVTLAGLKPRRTKAYTKDDLKEAVMSVQQGLKEGEQMSYTLFNKRTGITHGSVKKLFGNWEELMRELNIDCHSQHKKRVSDEDLLLDYLAVLDKLKRPPTTADMIKHGQHVPSTYHSRFGGINKTGEKAITLGMQNGLIDEEKGNEMIASLNLPAFDAKYVTMDDRAVMGEAINFRCMQHAPTHELGVIYVFGMICTELGIIVERIGPWYPDCEAKRRTTNETWQRVKIEFEYRSKNFLEHGHDPAKCDIIICWEHNWDKCPLEVIALREKVAQLAADEK